MPLKTKQNQPGGGKGGVCALSAAKKGPCHGKKVVTKSAAKSGSATKLKTIKKSGRKVARTKAGFELYTSDSEDQNEREVKQRPRKEPSNPAGVRTLVQDLTTSRSLCEENPLPPQTAEGAVDGEQKDMSYVVQRHRGDGPAAAFNKRLVSSTPDPERFVDFDDDVQMIPEHDCGPGDEREERVGEDGANELLSDAERMKLRQQLDAHLIEEALAKNKNFQDAVRHLTAKQKQQQQPRKVDRPQSASSSSAPTSRSILTASSSQNVMTEAKGMVPVSIPVIQNTQAAHMRRALTKTEGQTIVHSRPTSAQSGGTQMQLATGYGPCTYADTSEASSSAVPQDSPSTTWANWSGVLKSHQQQEGSVSAKQGRGSDIGTFQNYIEQNNASIPPGLRRQKDGGDSAHPQHNEGARGYSQVPTNLSMGFTPLKTKGTVPFSSSSESGATYCKPLGVVVDDHEDETGDHKEHTHLATPACSPVRSSSRASQEAPRRPPFIPSGVAPASSASSVKQGLQISAAKPQSKTNKPPSKEGAASVPNKSLKGARPKVSPRDNYTADGYYINRSEDEGKENVDESTPRSRHFTPSSYPQPFNKSSELTPSPDARTATASPAQLNQNNSASHLNTNQNMNNGDSFESPRYPNPYYSHHPEALADLEDDCEEEFDMDPPTELGLYEKMELEELQRLYTNAEVKHGPRNVRKLLHDLKQTVAIHGDLETCRMVQQLQVLVDSLPQLRINFNLPVEIALHQQPYIGQISQLNRRIRILNMQLKERERVEKEGLHPNVQAEMLSMQSESMELHQKLVETDRRCHELMARNSMLEQELKQLKAIVVQKDREQLMTRQETLQQFGRINQELESMTMRNRSLQERLSASDNQNRILELNLRQREMELHSMQDVQGNYKQAVTELMEHLQLNEGDCNVSNANLRSMPSFRIITNWLKSSQPVRSADYSRLSMSSGRDPLDLTGNKRAARQPKPDGKENAGVFNSQPHPQSSPRLSRKEASHSTTKDSQLYDFFLKPHTQELSHSQSKGANSLSEYSMLKETFGSSGKSAAVRFDDGRGAQAAGKDSLSLSSRSIPPSPLTVDAVAAFNEMQKMQAKDPLSHSWSGDEPKRSARGNKSLPYHSDPEASVRDRSLSERLSGRKSPSLIHQWKADVEKHTDGHNDASLEEGSLAASSRAESSQASVKSGNGDAHRKADDESEIASTAPTLSEFPISDGGETHGSGQYKPVPNDSRHSVTEYFKKYPSARPITPAASDAAEMGSSDPTPSSSAAATFTDITATPSASKQSLPSSEKPSPQVSSPNSSLSQSNSTMQKDYFQGTELDLSLSTIGEEASSTMTGLTGISISSAAISRNDRKFRDGVNALDEQIVKVKESLSKLRKNFS